jgi:hypothetical protein
VSKRSLVPRLVTIVVLVGLALFFFFATPIKNYERSKSKQDLFEKIKSHWPNLGILTDVKSPDYFTTTWKAPEVHAKAVPIDDKELLRVLSILPKELKKYPKSIIGNNLHAIALSSSLSLYGIDYGGTNIDKRIYLTVLSPQQGYTNNYVIKTIHHEFSSILIRENQFPSKPWKAALPNGVHYEDSVDQEIKAIKSGRNMNLAQDDLLRLGFLSSYGETNMENDVNTYAELLFTDPEKLKMLANRYTAIKAKYQMAIQFYKSLDPQFKWIFKLR